MPRMLTLLLFIATTLACAVACARPQTDAARTRVEPAAELLAGRWIGYYVPDVPTQTAPLAELERLTGRHAAVVHYFLGVAVEPFNAEMARNAVAHGSVPLITLEFWDFRKRTARQPAFQLERIASGEHDAYLRRFARDAAAFGQPLLLRPLHEMNGDWYPWGGTVNGNTPDDFRAAWRHIHDVLAEEGATNVRLVWCPNATSVPDVPQNAIAAYWPGETYVDFVAIDGYNSADGGRWRSFEAIFGDAIHSVTGLTDRPIFIAETGCSQAEGDKPAWIEQMFRSLDDVQPDVVGVVWFNARKEHDWRIESSVDSAAAFRTASAAWASRPQ